MNEAFRVLVVEDDRDCAEALSACLEMQGYEVDIAANGREAVRVAIARLPNAILCDIGLPEMDGFEVAEVLRELRALRTSRLIAITGRDDAESRARANAAGFDDYLVKPYTADALEAALRPLVARDASPSS